MHEVKQRSKRNLSPGQYIIFGFLALIAIGTVLLMLPISTVSRTLASFETASFTAVSATCVTGLVVEDTMTYWSLFGQIIILLMIQIGGLGFMTMAILLSLIVKRTVTPRERLIAAQLLNLSNPGGMVRLIRRTLLGTFVIEFLGAVVLTTQFIPAFGIGGGIYRGIFHSVSAFCNAGFDLMGGLSGKFSSLTAFSANYVVNITIMLLILFGGIGFIVWNDIIDFFKSKKAVSAYSKFVLIVSAIIFLGGTFGFAATEWNNPDTIGGLDSGEKLLASAFQSVTTRTAGFNTISLDDLTTPSKILTIVLMFIGGASGSTAGGIKVGTAGLLVYAAIVAARGENEINIFKRHVPIHNILRAMSVTMISLSVSLVGSIFLSVTNGLDFMTSSFEVFSASATVGLTLGVTPSISIVGHMMLMLLMFFGRVGILTITCSISLRLARDKESHSYPDAQMLIG